MMDIPKGRYWDKPWSLVDGCTPCSPGCDHCWSAGMTHRFKHPVSNPSHNDDGLLTTCGGKFNGNIITPPDRLEIPLRRKKPTVYAVWNDFYHGAVDQRFRLDAARIMDCCDRHTFLLLTKRADQAANYGKYIHGKNIWTGLTVCNQGEADEKLSVFMQVPGHKWLSIEPMLSQVIIPFGYRTLLKCVILGGETGSKARPMHPDWVRSVRDQCAAAGVPFYFKQWGEFGPSPDAGLPDRLPSSAGYYFPPPHRPGKVWRFGRNAAGRLIDGRTHDDLPWRTL